MRSKVVKVVIVMLFAGAAVLLGIVYLQSNHRPAPVIATRTVTTNVIPEAPSTPAAPVVARKTMTESERQTFVRTECSRLASLAMNNDSASLSNILADLNSPEKDIRMAAIEAAKQFESTNAIPALKLAAANSADSDEAVALLQAVTWLETPNADMTPAAAKQDLTPEQQQARAQGEQKIAIRQAAKNLNKTVENPQPAAPATDQGTSGQSQPGN